MDFIYKRKECFGSRSISFPRSEIVLPVYLASWAHYRRRFIIFGHLQTCIGHADKQISLNITIITCIKFSLMKFIIQDYIFY
jgi:hypothetical protein